MLERVSPALAALGARTPSYSVISFGELLDLTGADEQSPIEYTAELDAAVRRAIERIDNDRIFVRLCALQGPSHRHLSFAGVFATSMPRRDAARHEQAAAGVQAVLAGRENAYADYYYGRHRIWQGRAADVMFSGCVEDAAMFGTAYVSSDRLLAEYFDTPLSIALEDPVRLFVVRGSLPPGLDGRLAGCVFGLADLLQVSLDVEFIVARSERLYITEVRPISDAHRRNWACVSEDTWASLRETAPAANVVNTPGSGAGAVVDLRRRRIRPQDFDRTADRVYVVNHRSGSSGTSSFDFLQYAHGANLRDVALVVDHGRARRNDHLQYVMFEDPGIAFCVHLSEAPSDLPSTVSVDSDGFRVRFA
jgi:hypothetical protein